MNSFPSCFYFFIVSIFNTYFFSDGKFFRLIVKFPLEKCLNDNLGRI